jgi:hypothetical protein
MDIIFSLFGLFIVAWWLIVPTRAAIDGILWHLEWRR